MKMSIEYWFLHLTDSYRDGMYSKAIGSHLAAEINEDVDRVLVSSLDRQLRDGMYSKAIGSHLASGW
jgi:hypothetical protein